MTAVTSAGGGRYELRPALVTDSRDSRRKRLVSQSGRQAVRQAVRCDSTVVRFAGLGAVGLASWLSVGCTSVCYVSHGAPSDTEFHAS